jgi:hypothetical protein
MRLLRNEKGIALLMILVLSAILLGVMAALLYMITSGTQISGMQKRYKTALEAGVGGINISYEFIGARGDPGIPDLPVTIMASSQCLTDKLTKSTANWDPSCDYTQNIDVSSSSTYDWQFDLGNYRVYSKVVDTVQGNSGGDLGLVKGGVVSANSGEITAVSIPYLYTIEVDAENTSNPNERAKMSVLYEY